MVLESQQPSPSATMNFNPTTSSVNVPTNVTDLVNWFLGGGPNALLTGVNTPSNAVGGGGGTIGDISGLTTGTDTSGTGTTTNNYPMATYNASDFQVPDVNKYVSDAYNSLAPYYQKLITEANGDMNVAIQRLEQDYQNGTRYTTEDLARNVGNTVENLQATIKQLIGVTFPTETNTLMSSLNQRGIATTKADQTAPLTPVKPNVGGQGGVELGMLSEDQQLRKEAQERTAAQNIQQYGITAQRTQEKAGITQQRGKEDVTRNLQKTEEQLQQEREQKALSMGQQKQQDVMNQQMLNVQKATLNARYGNPVTGTAGSNLTDAQKHINPSSGVWDDNYYAQHYG